MMLERRTNTVLLLLIGSTIFLRPAPTLAYAQEENRWFSQFWRIAEPTILESPYMVGRSQGKQEPQAGHQSSLPKWLSISANLDYAYRNTNFYKSGHNTALFQGDSRLEFWMPPGRENFSWGPYVRFAGLTSNRSYAWENAWLSQPGFGFNAYPFSSPEFKLFSEKKTLLLMFIYNSFKTFNENSKNAASSNEPKKYENLVNLLWEDTIDFFKPGAG